MTQRIVNQEKTPQAPEISLSVTQPFDLERAHILLTSAPIALLGLSPEGICNFAAGKCLATMKLNVQEILGRSIYDIFKDQPHLTRDVRQALEGRPITASTEIEDSTFEMMYTPVRDANQKIIGISVIAVDATVRKLLEQVIWQEKERAQVTLMAIGEGMITVDNTGRIQYLNPVAERLTGWLNLEAQGRQLEEVFQTSNGTAEYNSTIPHKSVNNRKTEIETILLNRTNEQFDIEHCATPIHDREGDVIGEVVVFRDVSETRALSKQLTYQASHDMLTGLVNRREFEAQITHALATAKSQNKQHVILYLDLDQFKIVNDTCGHPSGDALLCQVANLLKSQVRNADTVARLGGDEFGILLENCPFDKSVQIAENIRHVINEFRYVWEDKVFTIGASIGLAAITNNSGSLTDLLSAVDSACYMAKDNGRNRVQIYQPGDTEMTSRHNEMEWVQKINKAFEEDRFCLYFQTIKPFDVTATGEHYEVLLRMIREDGQIISPMAFIPAAERYNLMITIDRWVINAAFSAYNRLHKDNPARPLSTCSINLSAASMSDPSILTYLAKQFAIHDVPPEVICFEITETAAIANLTKANHLIKEIKQLGCRFALDDFGSGFSSFAYLKNLPIDYLKIDASFIKDMVDDPIDCAMVEAINNIGHVMGMKTIAEFVCNEEILQKIELMGVDFAQGYTIAEPCRL